MLLARSYFRLACLLVMLAGFPRLALASDPAKLLADLRALPGVVSVIQAGSPIPGTYYFRIGIRQPVDHADPKGPSFIQRLTLLHRDSALPMVVLTDGYSSTQSVRQSELAYYMHANQLRIEHR